MMLTCMKWAIALILLVAGGFLTSCASYRGGLVLDPIGPPPLRMVVTGTEGRLQVFSAFDANADFGSNPYRRRYSDYKVFDSDGNFLRTVRNDEGPLLGAPVELTLPVGSYRVVARANGYGWATVPVIIRPKQLTAVHLEGGVSWSNRSALAESNPVCLPHGEIAGWRANTDKMHNP
jgi:hypothetical protein